MSVRGLRIGVAVVGLLVVQPSVGDAPRRPATLQEVTALRRAWIARIAASDRVESAGEAVPPGLALRALTTHSAAALHFEVALPSRGEARLQLFDVQGRRLADHDLTSLARGVHAVWIDRSDLPSGVYWARLRRPDAEVSTQVLLAR